MFENAIATRFPLLFGGLLFVDVLSVSNLEDDHDHPIIEDFVNESILPHTDAVYVVVALQLSGAVGSRSVG